MVTTCEREFVQRCLLENERVDRRDVYSFRDLRVEFGVEQGCCHVDLGRTKVLSQVSCSVVAPRATRESEGTLQINVELPAMAHRTFDTGRQSDLCTEITRLLERALRDSRCIDMESLCIVTAEKVWCIRVDIHILNHDGNLLDAACVAAISGLAHFRRPDVTVTGSDVCIHPADERDPVPLSIFHWPIFVTFAWFQQGRYLLIDPTYLEEQCMEGKMVIAMNSHREVCTLHAGGSMLLVMEQINTCVSMALTKVVNITNCIKQALAADDKLRAQQQQRSVSGVESGSAARERGARHRFGFAEMRADPSAGCGVRAGATGTQSGSAGGKGGGGGGEVSESMMELAPPATRDVPDRKPKSLPPQHQSLTGDNTKPSDIGSGGVSTWHTPAGTRVTSSRHSGHSTDTSSDGSDSDHGDDNMQVDGAAVTVDSGQRPQQQQHRSDPVTGAGDSGSEEEGTHVYSGGEHYTGSTTGKPGTVAGPAAQQPVVRDTGVTGNQQATSRDTQLQQQRQQQQQQKNRNRQRRNKKKKKNAASTTGPSS